MLFLELNRGKYKTYNLGTDQTGLHAPSPSVGGTWHGVTGLANDGWACSTVSAGDLAQLGFPFASTLLTDFHYLYFNEHRLLGEIRVTKVPKRV